MASHHLLATDLDHDPAELASDGDRIVADADEAPAGTLQPTRSGSSSSSSSGSRFRELSPADLI